MLPTKPKLLIDGPRQASHTIFLAHGAGALGNKEDVAGYTLSKKIQFHWLPDGDHSFKPRKISGRSQEGNWNDAIRRVAAFAQLFPAKTDEDHIP